MSTEADIAAAIAAVGPLFDQSQPTTNAMTGETAAEAEATIQEAVAAAEGDQPAAEAPEAAQEEPAASPPQDDPTTRRLAMVAREKAKIEAERARLRAEREEIQQRARAVEEYQQRKAKAKEDPFEFLKAETGLEFEDLARSIIAKAEPPKDPDPIEEARSVRAEVERLRHELMQERAAKQAEAAALEVKSELRAKLDEFPTLATAVKSPEVRATLAAVGIGDPEQRVLDTMIYVYRNGGEAVIDGKHYIWPPRTELPVDLAARAVDNELMEFARRLATLSGTTQATPTAQSKVAALAEKTPPGKSATKPRTLSNTRASTPTSPVRESRTFASEEDEIRDLARQFDVWNK